MAKIQIDSNKVKHESFMFWVRAETDSLKKRGEEMMRQDREPELLKFLDFIHDRNVNEFYVKEWQQNNFFPIYKFVKDGNSWGKYFIKNTGRLCDYGRYTEEQLLYYYHKCSIKIANYEMKDSKKYNFE